jgi:hypothetical protein
MKKTSIALILLVTIFSLGIFAETQYVQLIKNGNIRFAPRIKSSLIVTALKGDIFKFINEKKSWVTINMFSGEYRYIHSSLVQKTNHKPSNTDKNISKNIFNELQKAEDRAMKKSEKLYPNNLMKQIDYNRILDDKYKLELFHKYQVNPILYMDIVLQNINR